MQLGEIVCSFCGDASDIQFKCELHGLCVDCCSSWTESICQEASKIRTHASLDWIGCPGLNTEDDSNTSQWCDHPIFFDELATISSVEHLLDVADRVWKSRLEELTDTLNLRCPSCRTVLDPDAEACTAMCCSYCSSHFCFACLEQFPNQEAAHQHVPTAHGCESAFAPKVLVDSSHKYLRTKAILDVIRPISRASRVSGNDLLMKMTDDLDSLNLPNSVEQLEEIIVEEIIVENKAEVGMMNTLTQDERDQIEAIRVMFGRRVIEFDSGLSSTLLPEPVSADGEEERRVNDKIQLARALRINAERGNWTAIEQILESLPEENLRFEIDWSEGDIAARTLLFTVVLNPNESKEEVYRRVKFLLEHHCDPTISTSNGFYPLHLALFNDNQPLFELLADHVSKMPHQTSNELSQTCIFDRYLHGTSGRSVLHVACEKGRKAAVEYLLRRGANPMLVDSKQSSCLHLAIMFAAPSNALEISELLLHDTDNRVRLDLIEQVGDAGCRALHLAIFTNNLSLMKYLIECGADKEAPIAQNQRTPLGYACELDRIDAAVLLLDSGAREESFHGLPEAWKRDYVNNWIEKRKQVHLDSTMGLSMSMPCSSDTMIVDERVGQGMVGVQVYVKVFSEEEGVAKETVGVVVGHCLDEKSGMVLHEVELQGGRKTNNGRNGEAAAAGEIDCCIKLSYIEVLSAHIAFFTEFGADGAFIPLVAIK